MFDYLKEKIKSFTTKEFIVKGENSIGYVDINVNLKCYIGDVLVLADGHDTGKTQPLLLTNYKELGPIKSILKQSINEQNYSLRCYFDEDLDAFVQINIIDYNIDSAILYKRFERIFYNKAQELFIDSDGNEYKEELWSNTIIGNRVFEITKDNIKYEYDRAYAIKDIYEADIKTINGKYNAKIEECMYHRGIESQYVNREITLVSHIQTEKEKSINIYIGLDIPLKTLKIS